MATRAAPGRHRPRRLPTAAPLAAAVRRIVAALGRAPARPRGSFRELDPHLLRDIGLGRSAVALGRARR
jgi:uncharacterized protein YjiS (DUF1127 family)